MEFPHGETVTRLRAGTRTDPYSLADTLDWDAPLPEVAFPGSAVWPAGTSEPLSLDRVSVEADYEVALVYGADITPVDRIRLDDRPGTPICEVVGQPFAWRHPMTGWSPATVVQLRHIGG